MDKKMAIYTLVVLAVLLGAFYFLRPSSSVQQNQGQSPVNQTPVTSNQEQTPPAETTNAGAKPNTAEKTTPGTSTSNNVESPAPVQTASPKRYNVSIINFAFNPSILNINKGDTVFWTNSDSAPHRVLGDNLDSLNGPVMNINETYSFTFTDSGTFNYRCSIHPMMKASVVVK